MRFTHASTITESPPVLDSSAAILLVDDNPAKRLSIAAALSPLALRIVEADSGEAALHAVLRRTYAVILMDVQMPIMDGYETAKLIRMRSESEHTPIIFITAHDRDEAQIPMAYDSGAVDFIFGTIVPDVLRAKVSIFTELFLKSQALEDSLRDVTVISDRFRDSEARTRAVLENVADGIVTVSDEGVIESFNRAASGLFGYSEQEAVGKSFSTMVAAKYPGQFPDQQFLTEQQRHGRSAKSTGRRKDGSTFPMDLELSDVQLGTRKIHIGCLRDISERQTYTETLQYRALHDDLTDLPNRVLFGDRVNHAIQVALRADEPLALLVMDLNEFKQVNDTLGHQQGDVLLKLVAERLVGCLRDGDTIARLGGDEFGILPLGATDLAGAATVAWKIQQALEEPFHVEDHAVDVKASIGMTLVPEHGDNIDDLLRRADLAMYDAKRSGSGYALFAVEQEEAPARRLALLSDLRHCIENDELVLHYQPKIDLKTGETIGVEALIRWNHPSGEMLMPGAFMPEVEQNELMIPITEWVINEALNTLRAWRDDGYDLTMAVNLGARCLADGAGLFEIVDRLTETWGIPPEKVTFELTEGALIDTAVPGLLEQLQEMDERLSIDDFGTGYSSLVYLQRLPVVEIKADKSFVTMLSSVAEDAVIVRSIIDLAHNLSLDVVAEGVEDEDTMKMLIGFGCDAAQGYYFSRPVPKDDLAEWLETSPHGVPRRMPQSDGPPGAIAIAGI
jgi:diguanylate cyclase (GGDEF)-like protein/PAS domain S-box-containing protein